MYDHQPQPDHRHCPVSLLEFSGQLAFPLSLMTISNPFNLQTSLTLLLIPLNDLNSYFTLRAIRSKFLQPSLPMPTTLPTCTLPIFLLPMHTLVPIPPSLCLRILSPLLITPSQPTDFHQYLKSAHVSSRLFQPPLQ